MNDETTTHEKVYCYQCGWIGCIHGSHTHQEAPEGTPGHCPACCGTYGDTVPVIRCSRAVSPYLWWPAGVEAILINPRRLAINRLNPRRN